MSPDKPTLKQKVCALVMVITKYKLYINLVKLNDVIFETIELKMNNLKDDAKDCVLCIDDMSIKTHLFYNLSQDYIVGFNNSYDRKTYEPTKHVLCFMLRSINYN